MKLRNILYTLSMIILLSVNFFAGSVTATYSAGAIPTTYITSASVSTSSRATAPGLLTVTIPVGAIITSVNVAYSMTATSLGYMSEQRSFVLCSSLSGTVESAVYSGVGNAAGTYPYSRTALTIANNVTGGGDILFELHAFRVYGGTGSNETYNYVDNNSWQVTVNYEMPPDPPTNLLTTAYTNQMQISWTKNAANNNVIVAYNTTNTFGTPANGTAYSVSSTISGGGTIIYSGSSTSCYHLGLNANTQYFYKLWSVTGSNNYSTTGIAGNVTTNPVNAFPVVSNVTFTNNISTTGKVDIYFDVSDAEQSTVTISMEVSNDGGTTYDFACTQVTGDIGTSISTGTGKHIVWDFNREHSGVIGSDFKIKIVADDIVGDQIYYEGKIYNTVTIGSQTWLRENLDVGSMINITTGGLNSDGVQTPNGTIEKYCYDNNPDNCATYGGLYQWDEAMQYVTTPGAKGICPTGWHIPTKEEFIVLCEAVGCHSNPLKEIGQGTGTNTSGFSGLLAGYTTYSYFYSLGSMLANWSSTEEVYHSSYHISFYANDNGFGLGSNSKSGGRSVRCLKDQKKCIL